MMASTTALPAVMKAMSSSDDAEALLKRAQFSPNALKARGPPLSDDLKAVFSTAETSVYTNLSESYLEKARLRGEGPPWLFLTPKRVGYRRADVDAWLAARVKLSTSEVA